MADRDTTFTISVDDDSFRALAKILRQFPERLDKDMRAKFRAIAKQIRDEARIEARAARPSPRTPKHKGDYHWTNLVNTITSGADSDAPWVKYGSDNIEGWAGWEFGSDKWPQFQPRTPQSLFGGNEGYFFYPTVRRATKDVEVEMLEIAYEIASRMFGGENVAKSA